MGYEKLILSIAVLFLLNNTLAFAIGCYEQYNNAIHWAYLSYADNLEDCAENYTLFYGPCVDESNAILDADIRDAWDVFCICVPTMC